VSDAYLRAAVNAVNLGHKASFGGAEDGTYLAPSPVSEEEKLAK
jgi:hypothetical protein